MLSHQRKNNGSYIIIVVALPEQNCRFRCPGRITDFPTSLTDKTRAVSKTSNGAVGQVGSQIGLLEHKKL